MQSKDLQEITRLTSFTIGRVYGKTLYTYTYVCTLIKCLLVCFKFTLLCFDDWTHFFALSVYRYFIYEEKMHKIDLIFLLHQNLNIWSEVNKKGKAHRLSYLVRNVDKCNTWLDPNAKSLHYYWLPTYHLLGTDVRVYVCFPILPLICKPFFKSLLNNSHINHALFIVL